MDTFEKKIIHKAGLELAGGRLFEMLLYGNNVFEQSIQDEIDEKSIEFIDRNADISA